MRAIAVVPKAKNSAHIVDVAIPSIHEDSVLVKINLVGLNGTDKEIDEGLYGEAPQGEGLLIFGHESIGKVIGHRLSPPLSPKALTIDVRIKGLTIIKP